MRIRLMSFALALVAALTLPAIAEAQGYSHWGPLGNRGRSGHVTGFLAVKADSRLQRIPDRAITGRLEFDKAYFASVAGSKVLVERFSILGIRGNSIEVEGQLAQHFGRQSNAEATSAAVLRSGQLQIVAGFSVNAAFGAGVSYAFTNPSAETGESGIRGVDTKKFQSHLLFEFEFSDATAPRLHFVTRIHHRSGIYGLISNDRTGSNYIAAGLRFDI